MVRTLLVDNHDSYTFNLFQLLAGVNGVDPVVLSNTDPALVTTPDDAFEDLGGAHVDYLSGIANPVGVKLGPGATPDDVADLVTRLDPRRQAGRLSLIVRMGVDLVRHRLPALVAAVEATGSQGPSVAAGFSPDPRLSDGPLPERVSPSWKALTSGAAPASRR